MHLAKMLPTDPPLPGSFGEIRFPAEFSRISSIERERGSYFRSTSRRDERSEMEDGGQQKWTVDVHDKA